MKMKKIQVLPNRVLFGSVTILTGCLFLFSASTRLTWANFGNDGGDFLAAILTAGIPHPTGYPSYMLLGILFQQIPIGDPYFRTVLLSLIPAALSAGLIASGVRRYLDDHEGLLARIAGLAAALGFGLSPFVWSQAVIVEVHGLQTLFVVISIWWAAELIHFEMERTILWKFALLAFVYGVGIGNHITLILISPGILLGMVAAYKNGFPKKGIILQGLFLAAGLLVYLYLPIRAAHYPPINWGNPSSPEGFIWLVSGKPYQELLFNLTGVQVVNRLLSWANIIKDQFGIIGIVLAVIGAVQFKFKKNLLNIFLIYVFFISSIFAIVYSTDDSINYLLPAFLVAAIWIALGLTVIYFWKFRKFALGQFITIGVMLFIIGRIPFIFSEVDPRDQTQPADYAEKFLSEMPENAMVYTSADLDTFPLWYYHFGLKWREDVRIIVLPLTQFRWYQETLLNIYPDLTFPEVIKVESNNSQRWGTEVEKLNVGRPFCKTTIQKGESPEIIALCSNGVNIVFPVGSVR